MQSSQIVLRKCDFAYPAFSHAYGYGCHRIQDTASLHLFTSHSNYAMPDKLVSWHVVALEFFRELACLELAPLELVNLRRSLAPGGVSHRLGKPD